MKGASDKGIHLVGWDKITLPKKDGGLGVRRAREANTAMLGKLVWDMQHDTNKLWVQLVKAKYYQSSMFLFAKPKTGSHTWNSISKAKLALQEGYSFKLGDGNTPI